MASAVEKKAYDEYDAGEAMAKQSQFTGTASNRHGPAGYQAARPSVQNKANLPVPAAATSGWHAPAQNKANFRQQADHIPPVLQGFLA